MVRWKLTLEYDGSAFYGWQRLGRAQAEQEAMRRPESDLIEGSDAQADARPLHIFAERARAEGASVQAALEGAVLSFSGERVDCVGAGRTDSGVHALGQVAHFDLAKAVTADRLRDGLNAQLRPQPVAVLNAEPAAPDFHARFSAVRRVYLYRIVNRRADLTLDAKRVWRIASLLDEKAMHEAAQFLLGTHDFTTFRDSQCQAMSPVKTLDRCDVSRRGEEIEVWCEARSFLHRQVRSIVGSLVQTGLGKWAPSDLADALKAADRTRCGPVAPADGLYLVRVDYP